MNDKPNFAELAERCETFAKVVIMKGPVENTMREAAAALRYAGDRIAQLESELFATDDVDPDDIDTVPDQRGEGTKDG